MAYVVCKSAKEFRSAMESLLKEPGSCVLDESRELRQLGFRRGDVVVRLPVDVYYNCRHDIHSFVGELKSRAADRQTAADLITGHGHLPADRASCHLCVATDSELAKSLTRSVLDS